MSLATFDENRLAVGIMLLRFLSFRYFIPVAGVCCACRISSVMAWHCVVDYAWQSTAVFSLWRSFVTTEELVSL